MKNGTSDYSRIIRTDTSTYGEKIDRQKSLELVEKLKSLVDSCRCRIGELACPEKLIGSSQEVISNLIGNQGRRTKVQQTDF